MLKQSCLWIPGSMLRIAREWVVCANDVASLQRACSTADRFMPPLAIGAALLSALIHASWNAALKGGTDRVTDSFLVAVGGLATGAVLIVWLGPPPREAWGFLALSVSIHLCYWFTLFKGYDSGDLPTSTRSRAGLRRCLWRSARRLRPMKRRRA